METGPEQCISKTDRRMMRKRMHRRIHFTRIRAGIFFYGKMHTSVMNDEKTIFVCKEFVKQVSCHM